MTYAPSNLRSGISVYAITADIHTKDSCFFGYDLFLDIPASALREALARQAQLRGTEVRAKSVAIPSVPLTVEEVAKRSTTTPVESVPRNAPWSLSVRDSKVLDALMPTQAYLREIGASKDTV